MKTKRVLFIIVSAGIFSLLISIASFYKAENEKKYDAAFKQLKVETDFINKNVTGKFIRPHTLLESVVMDIAKKRVTYTLKLTDITNDMLAKTSSHDLSMTMESERQFAIKAMRHEQWLTPLLEEGWSMVYIQKNQDDVIINKLVLDLEQINQNE